MFGGARSNLFDLDFLDNPLKSDLKIGFKISDIARKNLTSFYFSKAFIIIFLPALLIALHDPGSAIIYLAFFFVLNREGLTLAYIIFGALSFQRSINGITNNHGMTARIISGEETPTVEDDVFDLDNENSKASLSIFAIKFGFLF